MAVCRFHWSFRSDAKGRCVIRADAGSGEGTTADASTKRLDRVWMLISIMSTMFDSKLFHGNKLYAMLGCSFRSKFRQMKDLFHRFRPHLMKIRLEKP